MTNLKTNRPAWAAPLLLWLLLVMPIVVQAQAEYRYTTNNGAITITSYIGPGGVVTIPNEIDGLPVVAIGNVAFAHQKNVMDVTIPNSVTSIGLLAFYHCYDLTNVTIGNNVISIGDYAFRSCSDLTSVTIGNHVASIGNYGFADCFALTSITIPNSVTSIGRRAFAACAGLTNVTIPESVTLIGSGAFVGCTGLINISVDTSNPAYSSLGGVLFDRPQTTLILFPAAQTGSYTIPNSVTSVTNYAFLSCTGMTNVTIPNSVTSIGVSAFTDCTNLKGVYFQGNAPSADGRVFDSNNQTTVFYLPGTKGWGPTFADRPTAPWLLPYPVILGSDLGFNPTTTGFNFRISWATNASVVVEVTPELTQQIWSPLSTNLLTDGTALFSDPQWTNYPNRLYRVSAP